MGTRAGTRSVTIGRPGGREDVVLSSAAQRDKMVMAVARPFVETVTKWAKREPLALRDTGKEGQRTCWRGLEPECLFRVPVVFDLSLPRRQNSALLAPETIFCFVLMRTNAPVSPCS